MSACKPIASPATRRLPRLSIQQLFPDIPELRFQASPACIPGTRDRIFAARPAERRLTACRAPASRLPPARSAATRIRRQPSRPSRQSGFDKENSRRPLLSEAIKKHLWPSRRAMVITDYHRRRSLRAVEPQQHLAVNPTHWSPRSDFEHTQHLKCGEYNDRDAADQCQCLPDVRNAWTRWPTTRFKPDPPGPVSADCRPAMWPMWVRCLLPVWMTKIRCLTFP